MQRPRFQAKLMPQLNTTLFVIILLTLCAQLSSEEAPTCIVTRHEDRVIFNIIGDTSPLCPDYNWANKKGEVLANHLNKSSELVYNSSDDHLSLSSYVEGIHRTRDCNTQDYEDVVYCNVTSVETPSPPRSPGRIGIVISVVVIFAAIFVAFCCFLRKTKKCSWDRIS
ncbi:uncharacterized protein LOC144085021 isoform X2 [Stigmatopora argus]